MTGKKLETRQKFLVVPYVLYLCLVGLSCRKLSVKLEFLLSPSPYSDLFGLRQLFRSVIESCTQVVPLISSGDGLHVHLLRESKSCKDGQIFSFSQLV